MTVMRTIFSVAVLIASFCVNSIGARASDETLAHAKDLYASAAYDEALAVLDQLEGDAPADARSIAEYRVFCLLALDRRDEARRHIEAMLQENPQYIPSTDLVSPRIQTVIRDVRRQSLPKIVMERYGAAKAAFERKDPQAMRQFESVLSLLEDPDLQGVTALADLRTVVIAFRDLTKAMAAPAESSAHPLPATPTMPAQPQPAPPADGAKASPTSPAAANLLIIYTAADQDVVPPIPQSQSVPPWVPPRTDSTKDFHGTLELLIDEQGKVLSASLRASLHPTYNGVLLRAARDWKFVPARKQGVPVRYLKVVDIHLQPTGS
jgi:hypothetical protein